MKIHKQITLYATYNGVIPADQSKIGNKKYIGYDHLFTNVRSNSHTGYFKYSKSRAKAVPFDYPIGTDVMLVCNFQSSRITNIIFWDRVQTTQTIKEQIQKVVKKNVEDPKQGGGRLKELIEKDFTLLFQENLENLITIYDTGKNPPSPIEKLFIASFLTKRMFDGAFKDFNLSHNYEVKGSSGKAYRADFVIFDETDNFHNRLIELDSHQWHEKTPEQAENDKKRERDLINAGYTLVRFTGREIYRDPMNCVSECLDFFVNLWWQIARSNGLG